MRGISTRLSRDAPEYFWHVPASSSEYHHPTCRGKRGLWARMLMLSAVFGRLVDSYVEWGRLEPDEVNLAHTAAILHDQRKNGDPAHPSEKSTSDHDLRMARVIRTPRSTIVSPTPSPATWARGTTVPLPRRHWMIWFTPPI